MSTEVDEMFEAMTGGLGLGLMCDTHVEEEGREHRAWHFFEMECASCEWADTMAVCDTSYYAVIAQKNEAGMNCGGCGVAYKPFDLIKRTLRVSS